MISFILSYKKNRLHHLINFEPNIKTHYKDYEIIVCEQDDDEEFKRGQLLNLGFKKSSGDILVFLDVDIRFVEYVDFYGIMEKISRPFLPWDHRQQILENGPNDFSILKDESYYCTQGFGGMTVFSRIQFEKSCGFSNLFCGWGGEDTALNMRCGGISRVPGNLYHIKHPSFMKEFDPKNNICTTHNRKIISDVKKYPARFDSFRHTIAKETIKKEEECFKHYCFSSFDVTDECPYRDFVNKIYKLEVQQ